MTDTPRPAETPACRVLRGGAGHAGRQGLVPMPELDDVPDRGTR